MKKIKLILAATLIFGCFGLNAQVGIGTVTPQTNSMLDVTSTTKGVLLPRLTTAERTTLGTTLTATPDVKDKGMQVFDTETNSFWYWNGTTWAENGGKNIYSADGTIAADRNVGVTTKLNFDANSFVIDGANNRVGVGTNAPAYKLDVTVALADDTAINTNGTIQTAGIKLTSDARLKKDIKPVANALTTINALNPVSYLKKSSVESNDYTKNEIGFLAQEVQKVLPQLVYENKDANKTLAIDYNSLIPVLVKALQEQQKQIEEQQLQISELKMIIKK